MNKNVKYNGFLLTEMVVSLAVLITILACMALGLKTFRELNRYQLARQRCIAAAQSQLDSIAATGRQISEEDSKRLWPTTAIEINKSDGTGRWEGLKLVRVKATSKEMRKDVIIELARYFMPEKIGQ
jgi:type II secretory pathway pseudopilin PulG